MASALTNNGTGTLTLSAANSSYTGVTTVGTVGNGATLSVSTLANGGSNSSIGASSNAATNLVVNGTLKYTGAAASTDRSFTLGTAATLDASGSGAINFTTSAITLGSNTLPRTLTLTGSNTGANTLNAVLADAVAVTGTTSVTKSGIGNWIVSGTNTYTGGTTVSNGTLTAGNDIAFGTGSVSVSSGGTLALNGHSLGNAIGIASGGIFSGTGTLTGPLTLAAGSIYAWNLASASTTPGQFSQLTLLNGTTLTNALLQFTAGSVTPTNIAFWQTDQHWTVATASSGTITGSFTLNVDQSSWASLGSFSVSGNDIDWTAAGGAAVPEPSTYAALLGVAALAGALLRRRRQARQVPASA